MGLTDIKKDLKKLDKDKLIDLVADLYKKNKSVKEFLDFYVNPNEAELLKSIVSKCLKHFILNVVTTTNLKTENKQLATLKNMVPRQTYLLTLCFSM